MHGEIERLVKHLAKPVALAIVILLARSPLAAAAGCFVQDASRMCAVGHCDDESGRPTAPPPCCNLSKSLPTTQDWMLQVVSGGVPAAPFAAAGKLPSPAPAGALALPPLTRLSATESPQALLCTFLI